MHFISTLSTRKFQVCSAVHEIYRTINTVKLGIKELLDKEQIGNSEPFPVTNLPVYLINNDQIGISEQFCDGQKVP